MGKKAKNDARSQGFADKAERHIALSMTGYDHRQEADWVRFVAEGERSAGKAASATATATATASTTTATATATTATASAASATANTTGN